jgi:hypothetical protein
MKVDFWKVAPEGTKHLGELEHCANIEHADSDRAHL